MIADRTASQQLLLNNISVFEILGLNVLGSRLDLSGSRYVIGRVTIRFLVGHFLLVVIWNQASVSNGLRDIQ